MSDSYFNLFFKPSIQMMQNCYVNFYHLHTTFVDVKNVTKKM